MINKLVNIILAFAIAMAATVLISQIAIRIIKLKEKTKQNHNISRQVALRRK